MPIISRNMDLGPALKVSGWRKVAIGTWRDAKDPSVYGILEIDATAALEYIEKYHETDGLRITMSHFFGKAVAETLKRHPQINAVLRWGKIYPRNHIDIFFQVATDPEGKDLSGITIRDADKKTMSEIATEMENRVHSIRENGDLEFKKTKGLMKLMPGLVAPWLLDFTSLIMYTLNIWSPAIGSPRDPFGSIMVTNIGSLGMDTAFAPLVPYSKVPSVVALGAVKSTPVAIDGKVEIRPIIRVCATFDHRLIDGVHASKMAKTIQEIFSNPEAELRT